MGLFEKNLENRDDRLRGYAAEGVGRVGNPNSKAKLEELFKAESSQRARLGQAFALVRFGQLDGGEFSPMTYLFNTLNSAAWNGFAEGYLRELAREDRVRAVFKEKAPTATRSEKIGLARILAAEGQASDRELVDALAHDREAAVAEEGIKAARALGVRFP